jgi:hypothetical protein
VRRPVGQAGEVQQFLLFQRKRKQAKKLLVLDIPRSGQQEASRLSFPPASANIKLSYEQCLKKKMMLFRHEHSHQNWPEQSSLLLIKRKKSSLLSLAVTHPYPLGARRKPRERTQTPAGWRNRFN